jgi:hypothetical protein
MSRIVEIKSLIKKLDSKTDSLSRAISISPNSSPVSEQEISSLNQIHASLENIDKLLDNIAESRKRVMDSGVNGGTSQTTSLSSGGVLPSVPPNDLTRNKVEKVDGEEDDDDDDILEPSPFPTLYCENLSGGPLHMVVNSSRNIQIDNEFFKGEVVHNNPHKVCLSFSLSLSLALLLSLSSLVASQSMHLFF